jgi:hypothetical protein
MTVPLITIGRYAGFPITALRSSYLAWFVSQDMLRREHRELARAMLVELHRRISEQGIDEVFEHLAEFTPDGGLDLIF